MNNHHRKRSEPHMKILGRDFQAKDKTFVLPSSFRLGLDPEEIGKIALRSGFMKRRPRKIEPRTFLQALVAMTLSPGFSMRAFAIILGLLSHNVVSKVAVFLRMKPKVIDFVREALFNSVSAMSRLKEEIGHGVFASFRRVLLQDSTNLSLPQKLANFFPGAKNQSGKTGACQSNFRPPTMPSPRHLSLFEPHCLPVQRPMRLSFHLGYYPGGRSGDPRLGLLFPSCLQVH